MNKALRNVYIKQQIYKYFSNFMQIFYKQCHNLSNLTLSCPADQSAPTGSQCLDDTQMTEIEWIPQALCGHNEAEQSLLEALPVVLQICTDPETKSNKH